MLLSIIVPFYNAMPYLGELLNSIESQELTNVELIFVNDGSTDNYRAVLDCFIKKHVNTRLISTENRGVGHAKNVGISYAVGDYIWFVDADDMICSNAIDNIKHKLETCYYKADILFSQFQVLDDKTNIVNDVPYNYAPLLNEISDEKYMEADIMDLLFSKINISFTIWYQLFRREYLVQNKIKFDETLLVSEDLDFKMETLVKARHIDVINSYIYVYRMPNENRNSLTLKKYSGEDLIPVTNMFLKWYRFFDDIQDRIAGQEMMRKKFAILFYLHLKYIERESNTVQTEAFIKDNRDMHMAVYESNKTYIDDIVQQIPNQK